MNADRQYRNIEGVTYRRYKEENQLCLVLADHGAYLMCLDQDLDVFICNAQAFAPNLSEQRVNRMVDWLIANLTPIGRTRLLLADAYFREEGER